MKRLFLASLFCLILCSSVFTQEARKIIELGENKCDDAKGQIDAIASAFQENVGSKIYIIYYTGKLYEKYIYDKRLRNYKKVYLPPQKDEALGITNRWKHYLVRARGIDKQKVVLIDGGFRENHAVEFWLVTENGNLPKPFPTLQRKDIKFRKGIARYSLDCEPY